MENLEENSRKHGKTREFLDFLAKPAMQSVFIQTIYPGMNPNIYQTVVPRGSSILEAIQKITEYKILKAGGKATSLMEAKAEEEIKTSIARRRLTYHELLEKELKVVNKFDLQDLIAPVFSQIATGLIGIQRNPEKAVDIAIKLQEQLQKLGKEFQYEAEQAIGSYVEEKMTEELELDIDTEAGKGLSSFE